MNLQSAQDLKRGRDAVAAARAVAAFYVQVTLTMTTTSLRRLAELRRSITAEFSVTSVMGKRLMAATYRLLRNQIVSERGKLASNAKANSKRHATGRSRPRLAVASSADNAD